MRIQKPPDSNILYYFCSEIAQIQPAQARLWFRNSFLWLRFPDGVRERRRAGCYIEPRIYIIAWMPAPGVRTTMESKFGIEYARGGPTQAPSKIVSLSHPSSQWAGLSDDVKIRIIVCMEGFSLVKYSINWCLNMYLIKYYSAYVICIGRKRVTGYRRFCSFSNFQLYLHVVKATSYS